MAEAEVTVERQPTISVSTLSSEIWLGVVETKDRTACLSNRLILDLTTDLGHTLLPTITATFRALLHPFFLQTDSGSRSSLAAN